MGVGVWCGRDVRVGVVEDSGECSERCVCLLGGAMVVWVWFVWDRAGVCMTGDEWVCVCVCDGSEDLSQRADLTVAVR